MMKQRKLLALTASMFALTLFASPSISEAQVTIKHIVVTVGNVTYCDATAPGTCTLRPWTLGTGQALGVGQSMILTQDSGPGTAIDTTTFNFDTSDPSFAGGAPSHCNSAGPSPDGPCTVSVQIDSGSGLQLISIPSSSNPLSNFNADNGNVQHGEYSNWIVENAGVAGGFSLSFGYVDNVHGPTTSGTLGTPSPWNGSAGRHRVLW